MPSTTLPHLPREVWTSEEGSMARQTALERWPTIVQRMVDDVEKTITESSDNPGVVSEGRRVQASLKILSEILRDQGLYPLNSDGAPDIKGYNAKLASYGQISWHNCPWLSAECDLYRYVQDSTTTERPVLAVVLKACVYALPSLSVLARLRHLRSPEAQCLCGFSHSSQELSDRYMSLVSSDSFAKAGPDAQYLVFVKMMEISLWGNATDPSLLSTLSLHQIQSLQGKKAIQEGQARIASNNMPAAWEHLDAHRGGRVDIVLDNAGLELFTNLVYSLYLLDSGLASQVPLHAKSIPWFVSDVIPRDFSILLSALADPTLFASGIRRVARLAERLKEAYKGGLLSIE